MTLSWAVVLCGLASSVVGRGYPGVPSGGGYQHPPRRGPSYPLPTYTAQPPRPVYTPSPRVPNIYGRQPGPAPAGPSYGSPPTVAPKPGYGHANPVGYGHAKPSEHGYASTGYQPPPRQPTYAHTAAPYKPYAGNTHRIPSAAPYGHQETYGYGFTPRPIIDVFTNPYGGDPRPPPAPTQTDPCFHTYPDCTIVNAQPFFRVSNIDLDQCKLECRNRRTVLDKYMCVSIVYTKAHKICDLYAHKGNDYPSRLQEYYGTDYFEFKPDTCGTVVRTTTLRPFTVAPPTEDECRADNPNQVTRYVVAQDFESRGLVQLGGRETALNEDDCAATCTANRQCMSFQYDDDAGTCQLFTNSVDMVGTADLVRAIGTSYFQKVCVDQINCDAVAIARRYPNSILVGFADEVEDAFVIEDCLGFCFADAQRCQSLIFFKSEDDLGRMNCVLNQVDKDDPETEGLFAEGTEGDADYYENLCGVARPIRAFRSRARNARTKLSRKSLAARGFKKTAKNTSLLRASSKFNRDKNETTRMSPSQAAALNWQEWSPCDRRRDGRRMRYRSCPPTVADCPLQTQWCNTDAKPKNELNRDVPRLGAEKTTKEELGNSSLPETFGSNASIRLESAARDFECAPGVCCPVDGRCVDGVLLDPRDGTYHLCSPPLGCPKSTHE